ncbi:MAG: DEAD/DEAH box helicase [Solirubrobacteraceae bacterium]
MSATVAAQRPRAWQAQALAELDGLQDGTFLISATPGAGKTRPALLFARGQFMARRLNGLVVVCPTAPLTRQWARAAHEVGLSLLPDADGPRAPAGFHGVVVTYARVARDPQAWARVAPSTLVVADEAHHLGEELTWGQGFSQAFASARRWLLLSGTPFRSDKTSIPGVRYSDGGVARPDVSYSYADAVRDGVCRPMVFVPFDGEFSWRTDGVERSASFAEELSRRHHSHRYRTALAPELDEGLPRILATAPARLVAVREHHADAGGLAVTADSEHARAVAGVLERLAGHRPVVVLHADPEAHRRLHAFKESDEPWIVAVNMVSEGVDIPRLRVGVYATPAKTAMLFRQIVGRFVRVTQGMPVEASWLFMPADPTLRDHAARIEAEVAGIARKARASADWEGLPSTETEAWPTTYEALAAVVHAETAHETTATPPAVVPAPPPGAGEAERTWAAFERRRWLEDEVKRLAGTAAEIQAFSRRAVLAWVRREADATDADPTMQQLETMLELLVRRLAPVAVALG